MSSKYLDLLRAQFINHVEICEKRPGIAQLLLPVFHDDGDMIEVFLEDFEKDGEMWIRISDGAMILMRLSYSFDLDTADKQRIFHGILTRSRTSEENGRLFLEVKESGLLAGVFQFIQAIAQVMGMEILGEQPA